VNCEHLLADSDGVVFSAALSYCFLILWDFLHLKADAVFHPAVLGSGLNLDVSARSRVIFLHILLREGVITKNLFQRLKPNQSQNWIDSLRYSVPRTQ